VISERLSSPMDLSELVYVVAANDDLPVSLQVLRAGGMLQPRILPQSSLHRTSTDHRDIAVYDEEGNDMAQDVTIEVFEYVVDENGDVFRLSNNPPLNCSAPVTTDSCTKALISEDITEPDIATNLKADDVHMMTVSQGSSRTGVPHNGQECDDDDDDDDDSGDVDVTVTASKSTQVNLSSHGVTDGNCENRSIPFSSSAIEKTAETNQNAVVSLVLREESPLPVCVNNNSRLSNDFQSGNCSVPSSPESLCQSTPDPASNIDLAADDHHRPISHVSAYLSDAEKYATTVTDSTTDIATTVTSCAVDTTVTWTDTCDNTCSSTTQLMQPCVSFSADCSSSSSPCEDGSQQFADRSVLNRVSVSAASADSSCNVESAAGIVGSHTDSNCVNDKMDSNLFTDPINLKAPVADSAADCKLDSNECQFVDNLHKPVASSVDNSVPSVSSFSSIAEYSSCRTEQHLDQIDAVSVTDISQGDVTVSALSADELDHCEANNESPVEIVRVCADVLSVEQPASASHIQILPSGDNILGSVIDSAFSVSELDHCDPNDCSPVESVQVCSDVLSAEQPVLYTEVPSANSVCGAVNEQKVTCLSPAADYDSGAVKEFVQEKDDVASPSDGQVADGVDDVNSCNLDPTASTAPGRDCLVSQRSSDTAGFIMQQNDDIASRSDVPVADGVDDVDSCNLGPTFDAASSAVDKECLALQPSSDTAGLAMQQNDDIASSSDLPVAGGVDDVERCNLCPTFDTASSAVDKECVASQPSSDTAMQQNDDIASPTDVPIADGMHNRGSYNFGATYDAAGTVAGKDCLVSEPSSDTAGFVMHTKEQQFTYTTANAVCRLQPEYTINHTYKGCQQDVIKLVNGYCSNIDELRQRLRVLHRTKKRLRKLQQNKPLCTSNTGTLQASIDLDASCHAKRKRLKLDAIDQELTERELLLRHKEEELNLRLRRLEQREQDLCRREHLLTQYCLTSPRQEIPQAVKEIPTVDRKFGVVKTDRESTHKRATPRRGSCHLPKEKVPHLVMFFVVVVYAELPCHQKNTV